MKEQNIIRMKCITILLFIILSVVLIVVGFLAGISQFLSIQRRCRRPHRFPVDAENDMVSQSITKET